MTNSRNTTTNELLNERQKVYGNTWYIVGDIIAVIGDPFRKFVIASPHTVHNWVIIMSKLIRALYTPENPDHWRDIAGYATLQLGMLEEIDVQTHSASSS